MRDLLSSLAVITVGVVIGLLVHRASRRRLDRLRRGFLAGRHPQSNEEFVGQLQIDNEHDRRLALLIRGVIAEQSALPIEIVQATDRLDDMVYLEYLGPDELEAIRQAIEAEFAVTYNTKQELLHTIEGVGPDAGATLADRVRYYIRNFDALTSSHAIR